MTMSCLVDDLYGAVLYRMRRIADGGRGGERSLSPRLERQDFQEQFAAAESDAARVALCQRWLNSYRHISSAERTWT